MGFIEFKVEGSHGKCSIGFSHSKKLKPSPWNLWFLKRDKKDVLDTDGADFLVVSANISSFQVRKILVDISSLVDILTTKDFYQIRFKDTQLKPASLIYDFANQHIVVKGFIFLLMVLGDDGFPSGWLTDGLQCHFWEVNYEDDEHGGCHLLYDGEFPHSHGWGIQESQLEENPRMSYSLPTTC